MSVDGPADIWLQMAERALWVGALRYLLIAAAVFALCCLLLARALGRGRRYAAVHTVRQIVREIGLSLSTSAVFAAIDVWVILLSLQGTMRLRVLEPAPGLQETAATVVFLLIVHDAYFYWLHRLLHHAPLLSSIHATHHRSIEPTPFAAFAFHPVEAVLEYAYVPLVALVAPIHVEPLFVFGLVMTALNAYGHAGVELTNGGFVRHPLGRYLLTPTHHGLHHSSPEWNYGFYLNVWDRLMGTNHPGYEDAFEPGPLVRADRAARQAA